MLTFDYLTVHRNAGFAFCVMLTLGGCPAPTATSEINVAPGAASDAGEKGGLDAQVPGGGDAGPMMPPKPDGSTGGEGDASAAPDAAVDDGPCAISINESFDTDVMPTGWSIENVGTSFTWQWESGAAKIPNKTPSASGGGYYIVNAYDKKTPYDARLVSPVMSVANCKQVSFSLDHYISVVNATVEGSVEVRAVGGEWQSIQAWSGKGSEHEDLDLGPALIGKTKKFQLALRYMDPGGLGIYWQVDDLKLVAQ